MIVKDTTAPVFNEINEVSFEEGTKIMILIKKSKQQI